MTDTLEDLRIAEQDASLLASEARESDARIVAEWNAMFEQFCIRSRTLISRLSNQPKDLRASFDAYAHDMKGCTWDYVSKELEQ